MKKIIAAAVAAAIIAPASVMAAGPTLYGKIHMSVDYQDNNGKGSQNTKYNEWGLHSNSSRIGVKGSEDLGNGMKVGYLMEWDVDMAGNRDSSETLKQRNRAITLSGDWGTALAGQWDTPLKTVGRKFDLFGDRIGDTRNLTRSGGNTDTFGTIDNRAKDVVAYVTPNMNGFSATVAYVFDAGTGNISSDAAVAATPTSAAGDMQYTDQNSNNSAWSFNAIYNNGPIMAAVAYSDYSDSGQDPVKNKNSDNATSWRVGGSYALGDFKVLATYTDMQNMNFNKDLDTSLWTLGGSYKMGNNTIKLQYASLDDSDLNTCSGKGTDAGTGTLSCDDGADMWTLGLDHAMSKRTTVYAAYSSVSNNDNAARGTWNGGHGSTAETVTNEDADAFSVGIIHKF